MNSKKTYILIIDDQAINRAILKNLLAPEYQCLEAGNGLQGLEVLHNNRNEILAILLDVMMPVMDGYGFLRELDKERIKDIPVIIMTGSSGEAEETKALQLGAWDFISKPYTPSILNVRLKNAIARSHEGIIEELRKQAQFDSLTGLFRRSHFFIEVARLLKACPEKKFALIRTDIYHFSVLNSFLGERGGDSFLVYMAEVLSDFTSQFDSSVNGRINADNFCSCIPYDEKTLPQLLDKLVKRIASYKKDYFIIPNIGVYVIDDYDIPVQEMYERATMAAKAVKGSYKTWIGYYDSAMKDMLAREQELVNEMQPALDNGEFIPYFQPKYDLRADKFYGAEVLVRWNHPTKGLISPGEFIPVFEKNGFIRYIDMYMWEQACICLRRWIDMGYEPSPLSVNISRINLYNPHITTIICDLVKKYDLEPRLLNLELTESAYMDNPMIMKKTVSDLQALGFIVMMDDFGSGYSSLNTLKDIFVDVLKVDMKFLTSDDDSGRSESILSSITRMVGWLDIPVIVEGVETDHQVDFLRSIGCGYIQGYYFARPMPLDEYEKIVAGGKGPTPESVKDDSKALKSIVWSQDKGLDFTMNSINYPIIVYEFSNDTCYQLRVNTCFNDTFGYGISNEQSANSGIHFLSEEVHDTLVQLSSKVSASARLQTGKLSVPVSDGTQTDFMLSLNYLGTVGDNKVILCMLINPAT